MTTPNIDHRATFFAQYEALRSLPMFLRMERTVEGSPWHREANVLVHTDMVVDQYAVYVDDYCGMSDLINAWTRDEYLGAISCAFHDTGKPAAEIEKYSEARGKYRAYHGHELLSAREFENYASVRFPMFTAGEIFRVCWMIENHMPWSTEDAKKIEQLAMTAKSLGATVFADALLADQVGRLSDDKDVNVQRSRDWIERFNKVVTSVTLPVLNESMPTVFMPIAPSGAGKSTFLKHLKESKGEDFKIDVFSLDLLRHEFYHATDYKLAYEGSVNDKSFEARANARFHAMIKKAAENGTNLYIDNTNLSAKRRKWYLTIAKKHSFNTTAVVMPVALDTLLARQKTRGDKVVPEAAVRQQYKSLQSPNLGEFDSIIVSEHNMKKPA